MRDVWLRINRAAACATLLLAPAGPALADHFDAFWDGGGGDQFWSNPDNWTTIGFPNNAAGDTYDVTIDDSFLAIPFTVSLDLPIQIVDFRLLSSLPTFELGNSNFVVQGDYTQSLGLLTGGGGSGEVNVYGTTTFDGAMINGIAGFHAFGDLLFDGPGSDDITDTPLEHTGNMIDWDGLGDIHLGGGSSFTTGAASTFTIHNDQAMYWDGLGTQSFFVNQGTIIKNGGAGTTFFTDIDFTNTGTLQVETGTFETNGVSLIGNTLTDGIWNVLNGSTLNLVGVTVQTNEADVTIAGAGASFGAMSTLETIAASGSFTISDGFDFTTQGDFTNDGSLTVGAGSAFEVVTGSAFTNFSSGTGTLAGGTMHIAGSLAFDDASIAILDADLTLDGGASQVVDQFGVDALTNFAQIASSGRFAITGSRDFTTSGDFTLATTGELSIDDGSLFRIAPDFTLTNLSSGTLTGGVLDIRGTLQFDDAAINVVNGTILLDGGNARIIDQNENDAFAKLNQIDTDGDFTIGHGRDLETAAGLDVNGRLGIDNSTVLLGRATSTLTINGNLDQTGGLVELYDGRIEIPGPFQHIVGAGGELRGDGRIVASLLNAGTVKPGHGAGTLTIEGEFLQDELGLLEIEIGGYLAGDEFDVLDIIGSLEFLDIGDGVAGTLDIALIDGFTPSFGDTFDVIFWDTRIGEFETYLGLNLGGGLWFDVQYLSDRMRLEVIPAPASAMPIIIALGIVRSRRRTAR
ncbi:MAG: hypothetical protein KAS72_08390 [Phycisphaerales bacterium]|nr:hypothetical protein [Phycisphaerales bacterium]